MTLWRVKPPANQAAGPALDELFGLGYDYYVKFADRIKAVSLPDVSNAARARLAKCVVTVSTPSPELANVKKAAANTARSPS